MADVRITALAAASSLNDSDVLHGVQAADNKDRKFSLADVKAYVSGGGGGTVSSVTAGAGLANSGTATDPIIDVGAGTGITVNTNNIAIDRTVVDTWYASTANASETVKGIVELATAAETTTGTDNTRAVHPAGLKVELDKKAPLAGPTFTGVPKAPTAAAGTNTTQLATTAFVKAAVTAGTPDASETVKGIVELATAAETTTGTDTTRAVHPAGLKVELDKKANLASPTFTGTPKAPTAAAATNNTQLATTAFVHAATPNASETVKGLVELATAAETTTGTDATRAVHPKGLKVELDKKLNLAGGTMTGHLSSTERTITAAAFDLNTGNFWTCGAISIPNPTNATAATSGLIRLTAAPTAWGTHFKHAGGSATAPTAFPAIVPFYVQSSTVILVGKPVEGMA